MTHDTALLPHPLAVRLVAMQSDGSKVDLCHEAWRFSERILSVFEENALKVQNRSEV